MTLSAVSGLAGCGLLLLALAATLLRLEARPARIRYAVMLAAALLVFAPLADLSVAGYARGAIGDPSISTVALAAGACFFRLTGRRWLGRRDVNALCGLVAGAALFLYPFSLGWTPFDPYALGYGSLALVTALLVATLAAWRRGYEGVVVVILAGALAYLLGACESRNLWDYLIDPLVAGYALVRLGAGAARAAKG